MQRFVIAMTALQKADVYMFDEPSSYLDVKQRLKASRLIRSLLTPENYVIVVEHDLAVLDYLSDFICVLYGKPGAYGVVTMPFSVREGINMFLGGYIPAENMRFREEELSFHIPQDSAAEGGGKEEEKKGGKKEEEKKDPSKVHVKKALYHYPEMKKRFKGFELTVQAGSFN